MPIHDGLPWPITRASWEFFAHMPTGPVQVGIVEHLRRDGVDYFAIRDGGYRHHPDLHKYIGQLVMIWKNTEQRRLELRTVNMDDHDDTGRLLCTLPEEMVH